VSQENTTGAGAAAAAASFLGQAGFSLQVGEAALFLAAALVLVPPELGLREAVRAGTPPTAAQREALLALWLETGAPPPAPVPMPLQPLAPGVAGATWQRLRAAFSRALRTEPQ
jgi:hypothetical protein